MGGANCRLVRRVARLVRMDERKQASEHGPRVIWVMGEHVVVACWEVTDLFVVASEFFQFPPVINPRDSHMFLTSHHPGVA